MSSTVYVPAIWWSSSGGAGSLFFVDDNDQRYEIDCLLMRIYHFIDQETHVLGRHYSVDDLPLNWDCVV